MLTRAEVLTDVLIRACAALELSQERLGDLEGTCQQLRDLVGSLQCTVVSQRRIQAITLVAARAALAISEPEPEASEATRSQRSQIPLTSKVRHYAVVIPNSSGRPGIYRSYTLFAEA